MARRCASSLIAAFDEHHLKGTSCGSNSSRCRTGLVQSGKRVVVLFEDATSRRQGRRDQGRSAKISTRAAIASSRCRSRTSANARSGTFSAMSSICLRRVRSCCSTAAGTTVRGVERVVGYCSGEEYQRFLAGCPIFEKELVDDDAMLLYEVLARRGPGGTGGALRRPRDRSAASRWKISPVDTAARQKYREYGDARDAMFAHTNTEYAPWHVVDFNDQRSGFSFDLIRHLLDRPPEAHAAGQAAQSRRNSRQNRRSRSCRTTASG